jgi:hypothetical protein
MYNLLTSISILHLQCMRFNLCLYHYPAEFVGCISLHSKFKEYQDQNTKKWATSSRVVKSLLHLSKCMDVDKSWFQKTGVKIISIGVREELCVELLSYFFIGFSNNMYSLKYVHVKLWMFTYHSYLLSGINFCKILVGFCHSDHFNGILLAFYAVIKTTYFQHHPFSRLSQSPPCSK